MSSIHDATEAGDVNQVKHFLELGISVDSRDNENITPLHLAAETGNFEVAQLLIENKCDIDAKDRFGQTALYMAILDGHLDVMQLLLQSGADMKCCAGDGSSALHWSSRGGHVEAIKYLVHMRADVNAISIYGETPLMWSHCPEISALLLRSGADVKCCTEGGWTALHAAASTDRSMTCDHEACQDLIFEEPKILNLLLQSGSDLEARSWCGETPLIMAAQRGNYKEAESLIRFGADLHAKDDSGKTALTRAAEAIERRGTLRVHPAIVLELITLFIESGAYIDREGYMQIYGNRFLQDGILKNVRLCTQAIRNTLNSVYLPSVYRLYQSVNRLPSMENLMKSMSENGVPNDIENSVTHDIKTRSFCNVLELRPKNLQWMAIKSLVENT